MVYEIISFAVYFVLVISIGVYFFLKSKSYGEKDYFLGGRKMSGEVAALSAGASDMSAWVLLGLPGAIYLNGLGQVWISIGLLIGTICAWIFVAPKLRRYAIKADDSITIPQFLANRFKAKNPTLRITCAIIFVVAYCIYAASSISACGTLFNKLLGADKKVAMIIAAIVIVLYTFLGGFSAVCWTDFFQGMLMLVALMVVPIVALFVLNSTGSVGAEFANNPNYYNFLSSGKLDWNSIADILTGLSWGLGYFGMPHILVRYMSIKSEKEMKKSQKIGCIWIFIILFMATVVGLVAHEYLGTEYADNNSYAFVGMVKHLFERGALAIIAGIFLSAIIAASMSTADSQLLASSSSFSSDIYKTAIRKNASDKELLWVGRAVVFVITLVALFIAINPNSSDIMGLVSAAWSIFGAAFGPAILLALYWRRFNYQGACVGIISGFLVSILWMVLFNFEYYGHTSIIFNTHLYEILPGFLISLIFSLVVSLLTKSPEKEIVDLFDEVTSSKSVEINDEAVCVIEDKVIELESEENDLI